MTTNTPYKKLDNLPVVAVIGATATGKTDLSLRIAQFLGGPENVEVINADAMQIYKGMDIGTAKLPLEDRLGFAHHQLDVLDVTEEASVAVYQRQARETVINIQNQNKRVIVVGGSGIYIRALLDKLDFPPTDPILRAELNNLAAEDVYAIRKRIEKIDKQASDAIHPGNIRRIIRAIEVVELTGKPFSAHQPTQEHIWPTVQIEVTAEKSFLAQRIELRTKKMFSQGLLEETEKLLGEGILEGKTARSATGYAQAISVLEGKITAIEAQEEVCTATRALAKKQRTWFRRDPRSIRLENTGDMDLLVRQAVENI